MRILGISIALIALTLLGACTAAAPVTPRLSVEKDSADLGRVPHGKVVEQALVVKNVGTAPWCSARRSCVIWPIENELHRG